jgi:protein involved in polysaccharide export with SLBB domain
MIRITEKIVFMALAVLWAMGSYAQDETDSTGYKLAAGDRVRVTVYGHADLSGDFEVDGAGRLSLPLIQTIYVANKTVGELSALITDKLQPDYLKNPRVSAEILNYRPFYIVGEVNDPGSYPYVTGMKVINAVAMAGGFTYRASKGTISISRNGNEVKIDIEATADTVVLPGDVIEIGERFF